jgi:hypothetical protein
LKLQLEKENIVLREKLQREGGFSKIIRSSEALYYVLLRVETGFQSRGSRAGVPGVGVPGFRVLLSSENVRLMVL